MARSKVVTTNAEIDLAIARAAAQLNDEPLAASVKYVPAFDIFIVNLTDGRRLVLQRENLQGLQTAAKSQLANVKVLALGTALHWEDLDVDLYVPSLITGIYGSKRWMSLMGKAGGMVISGRRVVPPGKTG